MPISYSQDLYNVNTVDVPHINPSIMEGEILCTSILGPDAAVRLTRYAPTNLQPPVVSGDFKIPSVLSCSTGVWDAAPQPNYTYQWFHNGVAIPGETNPTWASSNPFDGETITCEVTATNNQGNATTVSNGITVELIFPIRVEEQDFGVITGLNQPDQQNLNHFRLMSVTGLPVEDYNTIFDHKIMAISGLYVDDRLDTPDYAMLGITGLGSENTHSMTDHSLYALQFYEYVEDMALLNPAAEDDLLHWTVTDGVVDMRTANPAPKEGTKYWFGGLNDTAAMNQEVAIPVTHHALVDSGEMMTEISWYQSSELHYDRAKVYIEYLDVNDSILGVGHDEGILAAPANIWSYMNFGLETIPANTRTIRVVVEFARYHQLSSDGYVDDIQLKLWKNVHAT